MPNDECRMTKEWPNAEARMASHRFFEFGLRHCFVIRHSSLFLFSAKSSDGISFGSAQRREERGKQADDREDKRNADKDKWIVRFRPEKQRFHQARNTGRGEQAKDKAERSETRALPDDEPQNVADLRAERE